MLAQTFPEGGILISAYTDYVQTILKYIEVIYLPVGRDLLVLPRSSNTDYLIEVKGIHSCFPLQF